LYLILHLDWGVNEKRKTAHPTSEKRKKGDESKEKKRRGYFGRKGGGQT